MPFMLAVWVNTGQLLSPHFSHKADLKYVGAVPLSGLPLPVFWTSKAGAIIHKLNKNTQIQAKIIESLRLERTTKII